MRKLPLFFFLWMALSGLSLLRASDTRVESVGGLSLVMSDETVDINPFILGNPAGLALLPAQNRLDAAGPWFQETPAGNASGQIQAYGALPKLGSNFPSSTLLNSTDSAFTYQGLILFPTRQWAFQAGGDWLSASKQIDLVTGFDNSLDRYRGMARTAYDFGPFVLGTEVDLFQTNKDLPASYPGGPNGKGSVTGLHSTSGLLVDIPLENTAHPSQLRFGGVVTAELSPAQERDQFKTDISGNLVDVDFIAKSQDFLSAGPELYLNVPDRFQAAVIGRFGNAGSTAEIDSSNISVFSGTSAYKADSSNTATVLGLFKARLPLAGKANQILSFNTGGFLLVNNTQSTDYNSAGNTTQTSNSGDLQAGLGWGLESSKDFTVGLQASLDSQSGGNSPTAGPFQPNGFFSYTVSAGGERWLDPHWAFRMGMVFEDDYNGGSLVVLKSFYAVGPGQRVVSTTLTAGLGYGDPNWKSDFMLWTGQPSLYDSPNPSDFATQVGAELALSLLF